MPSACPQVAFASFDLLAGIVAAHAGRVGRAHALAVEHRRRGAPGGALCLAHGRAQSPVDALDESLAASAPEVAIGAVCHGA